MLMRFLFFVASSVLVVTGQVNAAEFSFQLSKGSVVGIRLDGKIEKGDHQKLLDFINPDVSEKKFRAFQASVNLNSPGGDVVEAMRIANLLAQTFAVTRVRRDESCLSSCFLIWASGINRVFYSSSKLGVHRISLVGNELSIANYEKAVVPTSQIIESFLARMGIPRKVIDKMNETPPSDMFFIDNKWLNSADVHFNAMNYRPSFIDSAERKCGLDPFDQSYRSGRSLGEDEEIRWTNCIEEFRYANQELEAAKIRALVKVKSKK